MSCSMSSSSRLHTHAALLLALLVALASMAATVQSFVVPAARLSSAVRRWIDRSINPGLVVETHGARLLRWRLVSIVDDPIYADMPPPNPNLTRLDPLSSDRHGVAPARRACG